MKKRINLNITVELAIRIITTQQVINENIDRTFKIFEG